ncbi:hypothetical protein [Pseudaestuariivita atlantica]|uniref:PH domain-containing protein n=1 Tax=Pseudaestuariivita atlantica TaxID=1317121 RepID=A0A0L1JUK2_9RHOB|nr:hypothetical protein [Pseudaestuariivita atlantica]KNG95093.1 hypothetical protein ATO11_00080 [Pseudaestuariivita atlantica]
MTDTPAPPFHFERPARTRRNVVVVITVLFGLGAARVLLDAAWGILAVGALVTLPAVWDMARNHVATLSLDDRALGWSTAGQTGTVPLPDISRVVLDTRLDLSTRMTLELRDGSKLRLPSECVPDKDVIDATCRARGLDVRRNAFALL